MVGKIIRDYMEGGGRKLTVPGFGTFIRRDGGEVIFVDLLRGDDRVLAQMVELAGHFTDVETMAHIDRFIFETKNAIEQTGHAAIAGFGTLTVDGRGIYQFDYSPSALPAAEEATVRRLPDAPGASTASGQRFDAPAAGSASGRPFDAPAAGGREMVATSSPLSVAAPAPTTQHGTPQRSLQETQPGPAPGAQPTPQRATQSGQQGSAQSRPSHGVPPRPQVGTAAKQEQGRAPQRRPGDAPLRPQAAGAPRRNQAPGRRPQGASAPKSTMDRVLLIAIIAAVLALAAMIFGLTSSAGVLGQ